MLRGTADGTSSSWVDLVNISTLQNVGRINGGSGTAFQTCSMFHLPAHPLLFLIYSL